MSHGGVSWCVWIVGRCGFRVARWQWIGSQGWTTVASVDGIQSNSAAKLAVRGRKEAQEAASPVFKTASFGFEMLQVTEGWPLNGRKIMSHATAGTARLSWNTITR